jgi:hypothetical protein
VGDTHRGVRSENQSGFENNCGGGFKDFNLRKR